MTEKVKTGSKRIITFGIMSDHFSPEKQQEILSLLKQCRDSAIPWCQKEMPSEIGIALAYSFIEPLMSLYHSLAEASDHAWNDNEELTHNEGRGDDTIDQFRQKVAEFLIHDMNRAIVSLDEEIEGPFLHKNSLVNSCDWYNQMNLSGDIGMEQSSISQDEFSDSKEGPERWIDKCLDMCGYSISLEVSVECLRRVVHVSNRKSSTITTLKGEVKAAEEEGMPNLAAVVTSLRTVRRRLLDLSIPVSEGHLNRVVKATNLTGSISLYLQEVLGHHANECNHLLGRIILPFEYYNQRSDLVVASTNESLLSESLLTVATTVIPALVSSACHVMKLPLPMWASKDSHENLLTSAFEMALAGNVFRELTLMINQPMSADEYKLASIHAATSEYFESLLKHTILHKTSSTTIRLFYRIYNSPSDDVKHCITTSRVTGDDSSFSTSRSILRFHFERVAELIPAKRDAASFIKGMVFHSISKHRSKLASLSCIQNRTSKKVETICEEDILPILEFFLVPMLSHDTRLREAVVNFVILSSSISFNSHNFVGNTSTSGVADLLPPRCIAMLLFLACNPVSKVEENSATSSESFIQQTDDESSFLSLIRTVVAVWCEEIFVSRTPPQQQQFVTEFLLYPLEKQILTQKNIEEVDDSGASLASMFIQVSFLVGILLMQL